MRNQSHKQVTFGDIDGIIIQEDYSTPDFFWSTTASKNVKAGTSE